MINHTLELDCEVTNEEIARFEECIGVIGIAAYQNVINLYYVQPLTNRERTELLYAIQSCFEAGINVVWISTADEELRGVASATYL